MANGSGALLGMVDFPIAWWQDIPSYPLQRNSQTHAHKLLSSKVFENVSLQHLEVTACILVEGDALREDILQDVVQLERVEEQAQYFRALLNNPPPGTEAMKIDGHTRGYILHRHPDIAARFGPLLAVKLYLASSREEVDSWYAACNAMVSSKSASSEAERLVRKILGQELDLGEKASRRLLEALEVCAAIDKLGASPKKHSGGSVRPRLLVTRIGPRANPVFAAGTPARALENTPDGRKEALLFFYRQAALALLANLPPPEVEQADVINAIWARVHLLASVLIFLHRHPEAAPPFLVDLRNRTYAASHQAFADFVLSLSSPEEKVRYSVYRPTRIIKTSLWLFKAFLDGKLGPLLAPQSDGITDDDVVTHFATHDPNLFYGFTETIEMQVTCP